MFGSENFLFCIHWSKWDIGRGDTGGGEGYPCCYTEWHSAHWNCSFRESPAQPQPGANLLAWEPWGNGWNCLSSLSAKAAKNWIYLYWLFFNWWFFFFFILFEDLHLVWIEVGFCLDICLIQTVNFLCAYLLSDPKQVHSDKSLLWKSFPHPHISLYLFLKTASNIMSGNLSLSPNQAAAHV